MNPWPDLSEFFFCEVLKSPILDFVQYSQLLKELLEVSLISFAEVRRITGTKYFISTDAQISRQSSQDHRFSFSGLNLSHCILYLSSAWAVNQTQEQKNSCDLGRMGLVLKCYDTILIIALGFENRHQGENFCYKSFSHSFSNFIPIEILSFH